MANHKAFADLADPVHARVFGGAGGVAFDDAVAGGDLVHALWLAAGTLVDSVQLAYRNGRRTSRHGGTGGAGGWIAFEPGELILALAGQGGRIIEQVALRTTHRTIAAGDAAASGPPFRLTAPEGHHIVGFHGRCGRYLDAVGARFAPLPAPPHLPQELAYAALCGMGEVRFTPFSAGESRSR